MSACPAPACDRAPAPMGPLVLTLAEFNELHVREGKLLEKLVANLDLKEALTDNLGEPGITLGKTIVVCDGLKALATARRSIERELTEIHRARARRIGAGD